MEYRNPPTVVVGLAHFDVNSRHGLLVVRRGLSDGYGKLALPGGYQEEGETWQEALTREIEEETGIHIIAEMWIPRNVVTVHDGKTNLLFAETVKSIILSHDPFPLTLTDNTETLEVDVIYEPTELAFPAHTDEARAWFQRLSLIKNV